MVPNIEAKARAINDARNVLEHTKTQLRGALSNFDKLP